jgi:tRNA modification GTPase
LFRFIDTAGLRESSDTIENIGIERTRKTIEKAQIVIVVHDVDGFGTDISTPLNVLEHSLSEVEVSGKQVIRVVNKIDIGTDASTPLSDRCKSAPANNEIFISAKNKIGIEKLIDKLLELAGEQRVSDRTLVSNLRHYEALNRALTFITNSENALKSGISTDLVAIDIRGALHHLGEITGEISTEDVLGSVFSRFCIGK